MELFTLLLKLLNPSLHLYKLCLEVLHLLLKVLIPLLGIPPDLRVTSALLLAQFQLRLNHDKLSLLEITSHAGGVKASLGVV
jgi:hypothetical protein